MTRHRAAWWWLFGCLIGLVVSVSAQHIQTPTKEPTPEVRDLTPEEAEEWFYFGKRAGKLCEVEIVRAAGREWLKFCILATPSTNHVLAAPVTIYIGRPTLQAIEHIAQEWLIAGEVK